MEKFNFCETCQNTDVMTADVQCGGVIIISNDTRLDSKNFTI